MTLLSLFDKQKNLLFICVGSSEYLIKILEQKYHVKGEGENFLTKFFAKEFPLKDIGYVDMLVNEFITNENKEQEDKEQEDKDKNEVREFLNSFVEITTYREYKTRYLQPLQEKGRITKGEFIEKIVNIFLDLKYKEIKREVINKNIDNLENILKKVKEEDRTSKFKVMCYYFVFTILGEEAVDEIKKSQYDNLVELRKINPTLIQANHLTMFPKIV
jgi:hypothetical protein